MTPTVPALLAAGAVLSLAVAIRPGVPEQARALVPPAGPRPRGRSPTALVGAPLRRILGRDTDPAADRRLGRIVVVGVALAFLAPPLGGLWLAGAGCHSVLGRRRARARADRELLEELPEVVDLLRLAVSSGFTIPLAVGVVAERGSGRLAAELARARHSSDLGAAFADSLDEIPSRLGDPVRPVIRVLVGGLRDGTAVATALERVADEVRTDRRRRAEERARRVSIRLLFPLVCCVLPAFALLTVVPLLVSGLQGIRF